MLIKALFAGFQTNLSPFQSLLLYEMKGKKYIKCLRIFIFSNSLLKQDLYILKFCSIGR